MTQIEGTDIWYYDFGSPLAVGVKGFLFKSAKPNWEEQTIDLSVVDGMNCYKANAGKKTGGSWSYYTEK